MDEPAVAVAARDLRKRYGTVMAVDGVTFSVQPGEIFGLLGPNGAGKTTTMEMLEGLRPADSGDAIVLGRSISRDARTIKERIGVQLQASALPPRTTVREAVELFGSFYAHATPTDALLEEFDLGEKANTYAENLSGGQRQRLSIALALVNDPELMFLDEPTTGLDPQARLNMWDIVEAIRAKGKTVVLTTHYMEEAERLCDHVAIMDHGKIVAIDTPARLVSTHAPGATIEFVHGAAALDALRALPAVDDVERDGARVLLRTNAPEQVLAAMFADGTAVDGDGMSALRDLRVQPGTLEDVFIALTGRKLRE